MLLCSQGRDGEWATLNRVRHFSRFSRSGFSIAGTSYFVAGVRTFLLSTLQAFTFPRAASPRL
jgi:hypothetical protein